MMPNPTTCCLRSGSTAPVQTLCSNGIATGTLAAWVLTELLLQPANAVPAFLVPTLSHEDRHVISQDIGNR